MRVHVASPSELEVESLLLPPNFGLVLPVCRDIGLARVVDDICPMDWNGGLTHGQVIEAMVLHILQSAERVPLYRVQEWAQYHHLGLLYDCPAEAFNDDRIGRAPDLRYGFIHEFLVNAHGWPAFLSGAAAAPRHHTFVTPRRKIRSCANAGVA